MTSRAPLLAAVGLLTGAPPAAAQDLDTGPHAVGFGVIQAYDSTRAFRPKRDPVGLLTGETARPVQVGIWYPARSDPGAARMTAGQFRLLRGAELGGDPPDDREAERLRLEFIQSSGRFGVDSARAAALWDAPTPAVRDAPALPGPHPAVLYFTGAGTSNPTLPAYLASHGFVVASFPSNGRMTEVSLEFTPNALTLDTDVDDGGFVYALLRRLPFVDETRVAAFSFSAGSLAALLWSMRDMQVDAFVSVEGWERFRRGADTVRESVHYDPARVRVPILMIERGPPETSPAYAKVGDVVDSLRYADVRRIAFRDAAHGDFLSHVPGHTPDQPLVYATAARMVRLFLQEQLLNDATAAADLAALRPPLDAGEDFFSVTAREGLQAAPTEEELFRLAETAPAEAVRVWREAAAREPGRELFREHVLTRAAMFARTLADRVTLLELVVEAYPESEAARERLEAARREAGKGAGRERGGGKQARTGRWG